jgi:hypothetical protein
MTGHSRWRLILLFLGVAGILSLFNYPYSSSFYLSPLLLRFSIFSFLPLVAFDWLYAFSARIRARKLLLLFSVGIAFTVGSAFHSTLLLAAGPCTSGVVGAGFPLPWYLSYVGSLGPFCPFVSSGMYLGSFAFFSFLFDAIFYMSLAIAGIEFYRWAKGPGWGAKAVSPTVPKEHLDNNPGTKYG